MDIFPIPPAPIRAIGTQRSVKPTIFSINLSRPKKTPGGGGGDSPGMLDVKYEPLNPSAVEIADLF